MNSIKPQNRYVFRRELIMFVVPNNRIIPTGAVQAVSKKGNLDGNVSIKIGQACKNWLDSNYSNLRNWISIKRIESNVTQFCFSRKFKLVSGLEFEIISEIVLRCGSNQWTVTM